MFWPIKYFGEVLSKLKGIGYQVTSLFTYDFSTLYTTLPHNLIKEKLLDLIERTFYEKEGKLYLARNDKKAFFTSKDHYKGYHLWSCQKVCDALSFLLDNIYILNAKNLAPPTFLQLFLQIKTFFVISKLSLTYAYNSLYFNVCPSNLSFVVLIL